MTITNQMQTGERKFWINQKRNISCDEEICYDVNIDQLDISPLLQRFESIGKPSDTVENRRIPSDCNEQERTVFEYLIENGSIKAKQVEDLLGVKESRTRELLRLMAEKGFIEKHGQGRSTFYSITKEEGEK